MEKTLILTDELLLNKGFQKEKLPWYNDWYDDIQYEYRKEVPVIHSKDYYYLSITHLSNTKNRDWAVHVDNEVHSTSGKCDIQTIEQFNKFMELLDIDFKL